MPFSPRRGRWGAGSFFAEERALEQAVEKQDEEGPPGSGHKTQRAQRGDLVPFPEVSQYSQADNASPDTGEQGGQGTALVASRHDGLGNQANNGAEPDPQENGVTPQLSGFQELCHH